MEKVKYDTAAGMRRTIVSTMCMAVALLLAASCNKIEEKIPSVEENGRTVITAVAEAIGGGTKAHSQYCYDVLWDKGDKIYVTGGDKANTFTVSDESAGTNKGVFTEDTPSYGITGDIEAFYPASLHTEGGDYVWPAVQPNNQVPPMYAKQTITGAEGETVNFSCLGAMLQVVFNTTVPNIVLKSIEIKDGTKSLSGKFTVDSGGTANIEADGAAAITLDLGEEGKILGEGANYFYIAIPAGNYENLTLTFTGTDDGYFLMTGGKLDIQRNTVGRITLTGSKYHPAILPGVFTVSAGEDEVAGTADDVKVRFSPGNLRYNVESGIWSFFRNQYDCGPSTYADGHYKEISLFTWGYGNWSTIPDTQEYVPGVVGGQVLSRSQDWGSKLAGGNVWRTLSVDEVEYLFKEKSRIGRAVVCGMNGDIIIPDAFTDPETNRSSCPFVPFTKSEIEDGYEDNIYSSESDWSAMESAGAVFFPATGSRKKDVIDYYGTMSAFWTATSNRLDNPARAYKAHMNYTKTAWATITDKNYGLPVRLVTDVGASPAPSKKFTIKFNVNGHSTAPADITKVPYGFLIPEPAPKPTAPGYVFSGWYTEENCLPENVWHFDSDKVYRDLTLYAKWEVSQ